MASRCRRTVHPALRLSAVALFALGPLVSCAPVDPPAPPAPSGVPFEVECARDTLRTKTAGKLTIATDNPAYEPWFTSNKPDNGEGFEGAVAAAVAQQLGFAAGDVIWQRVTFNNAIAPGPKSFDFDVNQFSISDERRRAVDFSAPYYNVRQAVIALTSSRIANARTLADLRSARLGAQVNTTSYQMITDVLRPDQPPRVYNSNDDAKQALANGQLDGLVVDLPTGFFMTSAEIANSKIVGQLPLAVARPEQFGLVLDKGSPLTACVSRSIERLRSAGTLAELERRWLAQVAGATELT